MWGVINKKVQSYKGSELQRLKENLSAIYVIPTEEESPQVTPQSKTTIFVELLAEIPLLSESQDCVK